MNPEDVGRILDEIGSRIGPAGEYAWGITVRQVYVEGILGTVIGALLFLAVAVATATGLALIVKKHNRDKAATPDSGYNHFDPMGYHLSGAGVAFAGAIVLLFFGSWAYASVLLLINPEYHAMMRLLERVVPQ